MQRKACEDILDQEYETMPSAADKLGYLRVNLLRRRIDRENADASSKTITNITEKEQKKIENTKGIYHYIEENDFQRSRDCGYNVFNPHHRHGIQ